MATALASKWTCDGCGVSVSHADGARSPLPEVWVRGPEGTFCLGCRRERAAEAALGAAPADSPRDARAALRRAGIIEFEVRRAPDRTDRAIANVCHSSAPAVAAARRRLELDDGPPAGSDRGRADLHAAKSA